MTEINIEYLITELVKAEVWKAGCIKAFGKEFVSNQELANAVKEIGRAELYRSSTFHSAAAIGDVDSFEQFCNNKVYVSVDRPYLTKAMLIKAFEKELRADYDTYCTENHQEDNH